MAVDAKRQLQFWGVGLAIFVARALAPRLDAAAVPARGGARLLPRPAGRPAGAARAQPHARHRRHRHQLRARLRPGAGAAGAGADRADHGAGRGDARLYRRADGVPRPPLPRALRRAVADHAPPLRRRDHAARRRPDRPEPGPRRLAQAARLPDPPRRHAGRHLLPPARLGQHGPGDQPDPAPPARPHHPPPRPRDRRGAGGLRARPALGLPDPRRLLRAGAHGHRPAVRLPRRAHRRARLLHPLRRVGRRPPALGRDRALPVLGRRRSGCWRRPASSSSASSSRATSSAPT